MKIFDFFKKVIQKQTKNKEDTLNMSKLYDIIVHELDSNGNPVQFNETAIHADSRDELIKLYNDCDQKITILREYYDVSSATEPTVEDSDKNSNQQDSVVQKQPIVVPTQSIQQERKIKEPAKYFNVGGVECKMEDGKIYQKQWMRILGTEVGNYRLISDANNREISLNGKHIEVLKWVVIEDEDDASTNDNKLICG